MDEKANEKGGKTIIGHQSAGAKHFFEYLVTLFINAGDLNLSGNNHKYTLLEHDEQL